MSYDWLQVNLENPLRLKLIAFNIQQGEVFRQITDSGYSVLSHKRLAVAILV